ncbi:MAG TPA: cellulase family glycosylhydrolase [Chloroflexi bacterium]|jgi:hypothetical protein|nr:cellulase family glycosylhydrolase [Chloroflexota bacterium]
MRVLRYGRWTTTFDRFLGVDRVVFRAPDGSTVTRPTFDHQPAELVYDHHGYEDTIANGEVVTAVRFTPTMVGVYHYRAMRSDEVVEEGTLTCDSSDHPGFVQVSERDPRYFALSNGDAFCPIGLCLCAPPRYPLPQGMAHFLTSEDTATLGTAEYRRWFRALEAAGANFARLWLSNPCFEPETEVAGELDLARFARLDRIIELARQHGIRLKLCLEHFRTFEPGSPFSKVLRHPEDGRSPASMDEWFTEPTWQDLWLRKVGAYIARYGDDPTVMAWELWNEIDCCATSSWEIQRSWTRRMLRTIKAMAPQQLVTNSLGSFDDEHKQALQDDFHMEEMDFQQVHRYLDQGAPWRICTVDPVAFSVDAVLRARRPDRPVILAETGAVNDRHTGPFRYYRADYRGILLHDTTFPAFFAGAAGTGQIWHWDRYVDEKHLWHAFRPFADLVAGIALDAEAFRPIDLSTEDAWILGLLGRTHLLLWVRNRADSWHAVLRDEVAPAALAPQDVDLTPLGVTDGTIESYAPWHDDTVGAALDGGTLHLPAVQYAAMVRIRRKEAVT